MSVPMLMDSDIEAIARRVVELLVEERTPSSEWVDARRVADQFGVSRDWVYAHADELGAVPLGQVGDGRRPRLRFDLRTVAAALTVPRVTEHAGPGPERLPAHRTPQAAARRVELLPIHRRSEAA